MSEFNIGTEFAQEKMYAASKLKQKQVKQQEVQLNQQESQTTGLQWVTQAEAANTQNVQNADQTNKSEMQNTTNKPEIMPNLEDVATLSSTVSLKQKSVLAPEQRGIINISRFGLNAAALEESFKEIYRKSKSHNLLLERFMSNVKLSGLNVLLSLAGFSPTKIEEMKTEVRKEALEEIEAKLSQDWAYSKAMVDIIWG